MQLIEHSFSVIGLAETNLDPSIGELYPLENYKSIYQETKPSPINLKALVLLSIYTNH
jgi:hypothetical protein